MVPATQRPRHGEDIYTYMARTLGVPRHEAKLALLRWVYSGPTPADRRTVRVPVHTIAGAAKTPRGPAR